MRAQKNWRYDKFGWVFLPSFSRTSLPWYLFFFEWCEEVLFCLMNWYHLKNRCYQWNGMGKRSKKNSSSNTSNDFKYWYSKRKKIADKHGNDIPNKNHVVFSVLYLFNRIYPKHKVFSLIRDMSKSISTTFLLLHYPRCLYFVNNCQQRLQVGAGCCAERHRFNTIPIFMHQM